MISALDITCTAVVSYNAALVCTDSGQGYESISSGIDYDYPTLYNIAAS